MQLALSVEALAPDMGGIGRYTWELAQRLPRHPAIDSIRYWRHERWLRDATAFVTGHASRQRIRPPRWARRWRSRVMMRTHLFHGTNFFLPEGADGGAVTAHDLSVFHQPECHPVERVRFFEANIPSSLRRAGAVITCSNTVREEVIAFFGLPAERVFAIPLGVSTRFRPHDVAEMVPTLARYGLEPGRYGLCVATLDPRKRLPELLEAWRVMPADIRRRWPLAIAGGAGWLSDTIRNRIEQGVAAGWVRWLGYVSDDDLPALYAGSAIFAYPSTYEGFGLPPIEAMASGVPVVVANASCLPEVTRGAAMLADPLDIDDFARKLTRGLVDMEWRRDAQRRGLEVAAAYSWESCVDRTVSVYRSLSSGN